MIKIVTNSVIGRNRNTFFSVSIPTKELQKVTNYLNFLSINPWEDWSPNGNVWSMSAFSFDEKATYVYPAWNKKYEQVIHDYNNLFHADAYFNITKCYSYPKIEKKK